MAWSDLPTLGQAFAADGSRGFWQDIQRKDQGWDFISFYYAPQVFARLGEPEMALKSLWRSYKDRSFFVTFINVDPALDSLWSDPRFVNLVRRMGLAP
jgi:hypothetical protein